MMPSFRLNSRIASLIAISLVAAACAKNEPPPPAQSGELSAPASQGTATAPQTGAVAPSGPRAGTAAEFMVAVGDRVFFDFDRYDLRPDARETLQRQATWLRLNPGASILVEGHADERGTREYNLALGARRANSVKSYLVVLGVQPNRITTITYGKERPVAACSNESCWSQNRRGVSVVNGVPTS